MEIWWGFPLLISARCLEYTIHNSSLSCHPNKNVHFERLERSFFCVKAFSENSLHPLWMPTNFAGLPEKLPQQTWLFCWGHVLGPFIVSAWHCQAAPKIRGPGAPPKGSVSTIQQASIYSTCKFMSNLRIFNMMQLLLSQLCVFEA